MRGLTEPELLPLWEEAEGRSPLDRASALLAAALPDLNASELDGLTLGQREAALLALRVLTFGSRLEGFVRCPDCGEALEVVLEEAQFDAILAAEPEVGEHEFAVRGYELRFEPLTCGDLRAAAQAPDADAARACLAERSVRGARLDGEPVPAGELPPDVVSALSARLAECDPQSEIGLNVTCPECDCSWRAVLDVAAFLWTEMSTRARRLLEQVHVLARSYGWREEDILELSARRRRFYLELAR